MKLINNPILLAQFKAGEESAFRVIYDLLWQKLLNNVKGKIFYDTVARDLTAEDIVVGAFCKLHAHRAEMVDLDHIQNFCYLIVDRDVKRFLGKREQEWGRKLDWYYTQPEHCDLYGRLDFQREQEQLLQKIITWALQNLPGEKCKQVFQLYFVEGFETVDIMEQLQISRQTAINHKNLAIAFVKKHAKTLGIDGKIIQRECRAKDALKRRIKCLENGAVYESIAQAARELGVSERVVSNIVLGKTKKKIFNFELV